MLAHLMKTSNNEALVLPPPPTALKLDVHGKGQNDVFGVDKLPQFIKRVSRDPHL